jgi:hypothetical protein
MALHFHTALMPGASERNLAHLWRQFITMWQMVAIPAPQGRVTGVVKKKLQLQRFHMVTFFANLDRRREFVESRPGGDFVTPQCNILGGYPPSSRIVGVRFLMKRLYPKFLNRALKSGCFFIRAIFCDFDF